MATTPRGYVYQDDLNAANNPPLDLQALAESIDDDITALVAAPAWTAITLGAGWSHTSPWTGARYRKRWGRVATQGRVTGTGGVGNAIFTYAAGHLPSFDAIDGAGNDYAIWTADANGTAVRLAVRSDGLVVCLTAGTITGLSLAPLAFDVD